MCFVCFNLVAIRNNHYFPFFLEKEVKLDFLIPLLGCLISIFILLSCLGYKIRRYYKSLLDFEIPQELVRKPTNQILTLQNTMIELQYFYLESNKNGNRSQESCLLR